MNARFIIAVTIFTLLSASCSKEAIQQTEQLPNGPFEVTITGELGEFAPTVKSTAESCIRMAWTVTDTEEEKDVVWAYDKDGNSLGKLTVTPVDNNPYEAEIKGTLTSSPTDGKLVLVHSSLMSKTSQPEYSGGLTIDMSSQSDDEIPFVAYAVVTGVDKTDKYASTGLKTKFTFATSVIKVNAVGVGSSIQLGSAAVSGIENTCVLTINDGEVTVEASTPSSPATTDIITKNFPTTDPYVSSSATGKIDFYIAVPKITSTTTRTLTIQASDYASTYRQYTKSVSYWTGIAANEYINSICDVTSSLAYIDEYGVNRGEGIYISATGKVWAPVNCGYDVSHTYGLLYQWGRKVGGGFDTIEGMQTKTAAEFDDNGYYKELDDTKFYTQSSSPYDWYANSTSNQLSAWPMKSGDAGYVEGKIANPCPTGWRVPTYTELNALIGNQGSEGIKDDGWDDDDKGYWFNGTTSPEPGEGLFLPVAGFRSGDDGNACNRGNNGCYWSSSVSGSCVSNLTINEPFFEDPAAAYMFDYFDRASGYSVRCVKE